MANNIPEAQIINRNTEPISTKTTKYCWNCGKCWCFIILSPCIIISCMCDDRVFNNNLKDFQQTLYDILDQTCKCCCCYCDKY